VWDTARSGDEIHLTLPEVTPQKTESEWMKLFVKSSAEIHSKVLAHLNGWSEPAVVNEFISQLPGESALFVASSRPIRDIESFATPRSDLETFANRGLAGIDGNISTAIGIYFLYLVGYAIALVVLLHLAVDIKTNFLIFKYGHAF
jgi:2-succinyl-5-enolpyruvyl-6-hydroxy-3-cyclohexene-1-carboxylate synthase